MPLPWHLRVPQGLWVGSLSQPLTTRVTGAHPVHAGCISCTSLGAAPHAPVHARAHRCIPMLWEPTSRIPVPQPPPPSLADWLALQVPARVLLEGDALPLRCRAWKDARVTQVQFFHEREDLGGLSQGTELLLPSLQLHHSGHYHCQATVHHVFPRWEKSALVMVAVQGEHPLPNTHLAGCSPPSPAGSASPLPPRLPPRALHGAGAAPGGPGGAPRRHPRGPGLPQPPQPPAAPHPPPAPILPG